MKSITVRWFSALVILFLMNGCGSDSPNESSVGVGSVTGQLLEHGGVRINVNLFPLEGTNSATLLTAIDSTGRFEFDQVASGMYLMQTNSIHHFPMAIESVTVSKGQITDVGDILMRDQHPDSIIGSYEVGWPENLIDYLGGDRAWFNKDSYLELDMGLDEEIVNNGSDASLAIQYDDLTANEGNIVVQVSQDGIVWRLLQIYKSPLTTIYYRLSDIPLDRARYVKITAVGLDSLGNVQILSVKALEKGARTDYSG